MKKQLHIFSAKFEKLKKPHYLYGFIAIIAAVSFVFLTPPFQAPDEEAHYMRAYQFAKGHIILGKQQGNTLSACTPKEAINDMLEVRGSDIRGNTNKKYDIRDVKRKLFDKIDKPQECGKYDTTDTHNYSILGYLPAVFGIGLIDAVNGPPMVGFYLARLFTAIISIAIISIAIYLIPRRKLVLIVVSLLPMLVFQQSVISVDGVSFAILALFIAYTSRLYYEKSIDKKQWIKLAAIVFALCISKPLLYIFIPYIFILLSKKNRKKIFIILAFSVLTVIGFMIMGRMLYGKVRVGGAEGANYLEQAKYLIGAPTKIPEIALNTYTTNYGDSIIQGIIGVFGVADTTMPIWVYFMAAINISFTFLLSSVDDNKTKRLKKIHIIVFSLLIIFYFAIVNGAIYVFYSPVKFEILYGVQGRYFLPILLALVPIPIRYIIVNKNQYSKLRRDIIITSVCILLIAVYIVLRRYYLYTP